jgi:hypothetical protein
MNSTTHLLCHNCGALWDRADHIPRFRLEPIIEGLNMVSVAELSLAGRDITHCPKCPIEGDLPFQKGDSRLGDDMYKGDKE